MNRSQFLLTKLSEECAEVIKEKEYREKKEKKIETLNKYLAFSRQLGEIDGDWTI